jgi:hypothetical protein
MTINKPTTDRGLHRLAASFTGLFRKRADAEPAAAGESAILIYSHSGIIYWWPVWLYAAFCWAATALYNVEINPDGLRPVHVFRSPWLGISFLGVLFFVVTFSNMKTRGYHALLVLMSVVLVVVGVKELIGFGRVFDVFHLLVVYMNEAFYAAVFVFLFVLWGTVVFGVEHMTYYRFTRGQVAEINMMGHTTGVGLDARNMIVQQLAGDFFRHNILGLSFLGLGTGDFICKPNTPGAEPIVLENVVRLSRIFPRIEKMIG